MIDLVQPFTTVFDFNRQLGVETELILEYQRLDRLEIVLTCLFVFEGFQSQTVSVLFSAEEPNPDIVSYRYLFS